MDLRNLIIELKQSGFKLKLVDGRIRISSKEKKEVPKDLLQALKENKDEIVMFLKQSEGNHQSIPKAPDQDNYPLSTAQKRLWTVSQVTSESIAYNMPSIYDLGKMKDIEALRKAIYAVIDRNEILRTVFKKFKDRDVRQVIKPFRSKEFPVNHKIFETESHFLKFLDEDYKKPFDLENGPLIRIYLLSVGKEDYRLYFNMHHIIGDGWSDDILLDKVRNLYLAFSSGGQVQYQQSLQYKDYACWERDRLNSGKLESERSYWKEKLNGKIQPLDLPVFGARPEVKVNTGNKLGFYISARKKKGLMNFCLKNNGSLFSGLLTVLNIIISRYTSQQDIIIGSTVSGRNHTDLKDQIGFFANQIAFRNNIDSSLNFEELFNLVNECFISALANQEYPFQEILNDLNVSRIPGRNPLFDIVIDYSENNLNLLESVDDKQKIKNLGSVNCKFDLFFRFQEASNRLWMEVEYNSVIYDEYIITRFINHFDKCLDELLISPQLPVSKLDILYDEERENILQIFNQKKSFPLELSISEIFKTQVHSNPNEICVIDEDGKSYTYREIDEISTKIANEIDSRIFRSGKENIRIGVFMNRSKNYICSVLGILKASGTYVPLSGTIPDERLSYIISDAGIQLIICDEHTNERAKHLCYQSGSNTNYCSITEFNYDVSDKEFSLEIPYSDSTNEAYIIYTSGSSGTPKGVVISHRGIINSVFDHICKLEIDKNDRILQFVSLTFDGSILDIFIGILSGAKLVLPNESLSKDTEYCVEFIKNNSVSILTMPPAYLHQLRNKKLDGVRIIISAGDRAIPEDASFFSKSHDYYNAYGPTECSVNSTLFKMKPSQNFFNVPIGKPALNKEIIIVDKNLNLVPIGVSGEILIGGEGTAIHYLNRTDLTLEKFIKTKYSKDKYYRTGDSGRWMIDGNIQFLGRIDDQISLNGFRIEPGEIEANIGLNPLVENLCILKITSGTFSRLVAFIQTFTENEALLLINLKKSLSTGLPHYMIPSDFVFLKDLPLTSHGKIDKKKLKNQYNTREEKEKKIEDPKTPTQRKLSSLWAQVLGKVPHLDIYDNFFQVGGHSIHAVKLAFAIESAFNLPFGLKEVLINPSIKAQEDYLNELNKTTERCRVGSKIKNIDIKDPFVTSHSQERMWVLSQIEEANRAYNMPGQLELPNDMNLNIFIEAIKKVVERHEILRTQFYQQNNEVFQKIIPKNEFDFDIHVQKISSEAILRQTIISQDNKLFDLAQAPLFILKIFQWDERNIFYYNIHHIICDGWSIQVLIDEIWSFYNLISTGGTFPEPLGFQYKDYANWQKKSLNSVVFGRHRKFWFNHIGDDIPKLELPFSENRPSPKTYNGRTIRFTFSEKFSKLVRKFSQSKKGTSFSVLTTIVQTLLYRYTEESRNIIGTPVANRLKKELKDQIGFYVNTLPLIAKIHGSNDYNTIYGNFQKEFQEVLLHQEYPFDLLLHEMKLDRDPSRHPIFDIMLVFQNTESAENILIPDEAINSILDLGKCQSKFDMLLNFIEFKNVFRLDLEYNLDIYPSEYMSTFLWHLQNLGIELMSKADKPIDTLEYINSNEKIRLLEEFNKTDTEIQWATVLDLFSISVKKTPEKLALHFNGQSYTYCEINKLSNLVAKEIIKQPEFGIHKYVGVLLKRSPFSVIAMLAVMKAGGVYVPLDPDYPLKRLNAIKEDADLEILISDISLYSKFDLKFSQLIDIGDIPEEHSVENINLSKIEDPSFIIYTSGSTGRPKGILQTHLMLSNLIQWDLNHNEIKNHDLKFLQYASFSFDASLHDVFYVFAAGGELFLADDKMRLDFKALGNWVTAKNMNVLSFPYTALKSFFKFNDINQLIQSSIQYLISTGEQLFIEGDLHKFLKDKSGATLLNHYGPSETHVVTVAKISSSYKNISHRPDIGQPVANTKIYILDGNLEPVPVGVRGEIYIGGYNLADGYLNMPDMTAGRFVEIKYDKGRVYKTGDIGRWLPNGAIEFLGREDSQIKLRGYRIEEGEIIQVIKEIEGIEDVVISVNDQLICAYFISSKTIDISDMRKYAKASLPFYMIPSFFIEIQEVPLTSNDKVDRSKLPVPGKEVVDSRDRRTVLTDTENKIKLIWDEILLVDCGVEDDFFESGGHSLGAVNLKYAYENEFGYDFDLIEIFTNPTIEKHAEIIELKVIKEKMSERPSDEKIKTKTFKF